ncbi:MAG: phosphatidylglycerol lysyltransferase domain-containing protein [Ruminococcus sp.]|nr:phosphatidylglycerol lysyltransferase domain-containing protein [Ruminococcus sp.]
MLEFRQIKLGDKDWIDEALKKSDFRGCEYSFANNVAWCRLSDTKISRYKDFYLSASFEDEFFNLTFPAGSGGYKELFDKMLEFSSEIGKRLKLNGVNSDMLKVLTQLYGEDRLETEADRDYFDYIYKAEDLINLSGKKYHGKRNHIRRFKESDWSFVPIDESLIDDCFEFSAKSFNASDKYDEHSAVVEQYAINTFLTNFKYLNLSGGVLYQNGEMVGFTIGEKLNSDTFVVHIEKALSEVNGAYPCLCNEFARVQASDCLYINREEDLGIEGLRKSKESYRPAFMYEKNTVIFK